MKINKIAVLVLNLVATVFSKYLDHHGSNFRNGLSEDGRLTFTGLAAKYGFPAKHKTIITEDGYKLALFHIPGNTSKPVLLIHGNTVSSSDWVIRGNESLAITLAKLGYDVWAINLRGTRYSRRHIYLDPDRQAARFFNFTFYEQAMYDVPCTIDYILQATRQRQLTAIGHSIGTSLLYILGAEKPKYNDKIKIGISLAPISFLQNVRGLLSLAIAAGPDMMSLFSDRNIHEIFNYEDFAPFTQRLCFLPSNDLCMFGLSMIVGNVTKSFEPGFERTLFGHFPMGTSVKNMRHLIQVASKKRYARYDYGAERNLEVYGSSEPAKFNLSRVMMKSALFVSEEDFLATVADAELLKKELPNIVHYQVLPDKDFNHIDFVWGRNMKKNFYPYLLPVMEKYV